MARKRLKAGVIGCGTIGGEIARSCVEGRLAGRVDLAAVCDIDSAKAHALAESLGRGVAVMERGALIASCDLIIEAACAAVSAAIVRECLEKRKEVLVMSVGGLLGHGDLLDAARRADSRVWLPSGAICGIDGVKAAALGTINAVTITTRKSPRSLAGAPFLAEKKIDLAALREETVVFEGRAKDAVRAFPQNINVAAVLGIASVGEEKVMVKIIADPGCGTNTHEVRVEGDFGVLTARTENLPSARNPKTSMLAVLSAIATVERIVGTLQVGT